jgi:signal transduction histidine kinase
MKNFLSFSINLSDMPNTEQIQLDITHIPKSPDPIHYIADEPKQIGYNGNGNGHSTPLICSEKDGFLSVLAHDLRSPFQGLLGFTELLYEEIETLSKEDTKAMADKIHFSATNLFKLLENLLDYCMAQKGNSAIDPIVCNLKEFVGNTIDIHSAQADMKGIKIINKVIEGTEVFADEKMLNAILRNLISNAIKFSNRMDLIIISSRLKEKNEVEIMVRDSGIGMSAKIRESIFNPTHEKTRTGTNGEPSTGLGLMLCKEYIENHHGKIRVESEEGTGSTFYFTLPGPMDKDELH